MQDFRKLAVWQEARELTKSIYDLTTRMDLAFISESMMNDAVLAVVEIKLSVIGFQLSALVFRRFAVRRWTRRVYSR